MRLGGMKKNALVVTTINRPNDCLKSLAKGAKYNGFYFVVAGDTKSPCEFDLSGVSFLSIAKQERLFPRFTENLPTAHYARKNVAYLQAISKGCGSILETDDDNFPLEGFWRLPSDTVIADIVSHPSNWVNVYSLFSNQPIWPRGFPLEFIHSKENIHVKKTIPVNSQIIQGMADENPDVDAIYRLTRHLPIYFESHRSIALDFHQWCPFNSQNTLFRKSAFPLLYLPSHCSFRMTDIWRSFVAQRCLWEMGGRVIFVGATTYQQRNKHNLLRDLEEEIPGYLNNERIRVALEDLKLDPGDLHRNLALCYEALVAQNFVGSEEIPLIKRWLEELTLSG
jgi:hypothetical protein